MMKTGSNRIPSMSRNMKILLIAGSMPNHPCGVGDYTARLAEEVALRGATVYVLTTDRPEIQVPKGDGVQVIKAVPSWRLIHLPQLLRRIKEIRPDLVHVQYPTSGYGRNLLIPLFPLVHRLFFRKIPLVATLHEMSIAHWLRKVSQIFLISLSDYVIVPDDRERQSLLGWSKKLASRSRVIPIGANIEFMENPKAGSSTRLKDPYIVYFGFYSNSKDLNMLLEAFKKISQSLIQCRLVMIMELVRGNREHERFADLLVSLGLTDSVTITGYCARDRVSRYLSEAAICVLPFSDGVSLRRTSFLTALHFGLPTITTAVKDYPDILHNWENVVLVPVGDSPALAEAILKLLTEPELRGRISENARQLSGRFSWTGIAEEHLDLYRALMKRIET